jgi:hypothetical protein
MAVFKEAKTVGDGRAKLVMIKLPPTTARYLRVLGTRLRQAPKTKLYSMEVVEMEVYGK